MNTTEEPAENLSFLKPTTKKATIHLMKVATRVQWCVPFKLEFPSSQKALSTGTPPELRFPVWKVKCASPTKNQIQNKNCIQAQWVI